MSDIKQRTISKTQESITTERGSLIKRDYKLLWKSSVRKVISNLNKTSSRALTHKFSTFTTIVIEDFIESKKPPRLIIYPNSTIRKTWDMIIGLIMIYVIITTPLLVSFIDSVGFDGWFWGDLIINIIFIVDVVINLNTSFYDQEGVMIASRKAIFLNYLMSWLLLDLFTCIPFEVMQLVSGDNSLGSLSKFKVLPKIFRILRLVKMVKHMKKSSFVVQIQTVLGLSHLYMRLVSTIAGILVAIHVFACLFYSSAKSELFNDDTWVTRFGINDKSLVYKYLCSVYWAILTLTSVGYGDITPWTIDEVSITLTWMVFSIYFLSFTISSLSSLISQIQQRNKLTDNLMIKFDSFSEECRLPKDLKHKIKKFIKANPGKYSGINEEKKELLDLFSYEIKREIVDNIHNGIYKKFPILKSQSYEFLVTILPMMSTIELGPCEKIYTTGDSADEIFFILKGSVKYLHNDKEFRLESAGEYFGDYEVLKNIPREYTVETYGVSILWVLGRSLVDLISSDFPTIFNEFSAVSVKNFRQVKASLAEIECYFEYQGREDQAALTREKRRSVTERYQTMLRDAAAQRHNRDKGNINFESEVDELIELVKDDSKELKRIKGRLLGLLMEEILRGFVKELRSQEGMKVRKVVEKI